jgi:hypothetical protein
MDDAVISLRMHPYQRALAVTLAMAVLLAAILLGLLMFERTGPSPARPFTNIVRVEDVHPNDGTPTPTDNPNAGCKPKPPHDCRPSGK